MKTTKKALLFTFCAVLLVVASVLGTMAYLTSSDTVTNTFTVGKVNIKLDEAKVDDNGAAVEPAERVKENTYHLLPGHKYVKDPTVTVTAGSEESYVRMIATITYDKDADAVFGTINSPEAIGKWLNINSTDWKITGAPETTEKDGKIIRSYEFRYYTMVDKVGNTADYKLEPLFTKITVPGEITNSDLEKLADLKIDVVAHAIQTDGFETENAAWEAFDNQVKVSQ